jgi:hypothetical protein
VYRHGKLNYHVLTNEEGGVEVAKKAKLRHHQSQDWIGLESESKIRAQASQGFTTCDNFTT